MTLHDNEYLKLVQYVLDNGVYKPNRTGIGTYSVFGYQMRFNLRDGTIPLLTTKKMFTRGVIHEILWYLQGTGNIKYLQDNKVTIWDEWTNEFGDLGPVYGVMWRKWPTGNNVPVVDKDGHIWHMPETLDQIGNLIHSLKTNPNDRRLLVTGWNPALLPDTGKTFSANIANGKQALPPCHYTFQCYARPLTLAERAKQFLVKTGTNPADAADSTEAEQHLVYDNASVPRHELSMLLNQRSCDVGLGVPFNIVQYSILLRMIAEVVNMSPGEFVWNGGDVHVYENHVDALKGQLTHTPQPSPTFKFARKVDNIDHFKYDDFVIENYTPGPLIRMDVAV